MHVKVLIGFGIRCPPLRKSFLQNFEKKEHLLCDVETEILMCKLFSVIWHCGLGFFSLNSYFFSCKLVSFED